MSARDYTRLPLRHLVELVVDASDATALNEFHQNRPVFGWNGAANLRCAEFIDCLRKAALDRGEGDVACRAYDLCVAKFSNLPDGVDKRRGDGPDCRTYFDAFLRTCSETSASGGALPIINAERRAANRLQGLVARHYRLSMLECLRNGRSRMSRYVWSLPAGSISLMMPRHLHGKDRRVWLESHVSDPDPTRPGERNRIQSIVDDEFSGAPEIPYDETRLYGASHEHLPGPSRILSIGLPNAVAEEKAKNIEAQRPAVRALGSGRLHEMILRIFEDISNGEYRAAAIAEHYGLSKATFSRFAGGHWKNTGAGQPSRSVLPDLWRNAAHVVSTVPDLIQAVREAGVWQSVARVVSPTPSFSGETQKP